MVLGDLDRYMQKMKPDRQFMPYMKINSRWIKDLNASHDSIKVLGKNIGKKVSDTPCNNIFTDMSPRASNIKEKIKKWEYIKLKSFCMAKESIIKMKRNSTV